MVGAGVSGLTTAWLLSREHAITLFEQEARLGGHAHTHDVEIEGRQLSIDTGFMVFNERTYPHFVRILSRLGVDSQPSDMSFSVRCRRCRLEYSSAGLNGVFAQRANLVRLPHWRLLADIRRFFQLGREALARGVDRRTLGEFLDVGGFGEQLARHFVLPLGGAIWSASLADMRCFPAASYLRFMENHGLLSTAGQPQWRTIRGGSATYVRAMVADLGDAVRLSTRVHAVTRHERGVTVSHGDGGEAEYDAVVIATHADQALALLADPSSQEREALGRFRYSTNDAWLHDDDALMPSEPLAHASWNCDLADCLDVNAPVSVTYDVRRLQGHRSYRPLLCSLNPVQPIGRTTWARMSYTHPILDGPAIEGQRMLSALNGERRTWYCGAHLGYGFHEDGVVSALTVARGFGAGL